MDKTPVLHISVSTGTYADFIKNMVTAAQSGKSQYACVANVHMLIEAYRNKRFAQILQRAAFVTPDGKPLAWALRLLHGIKQERVAGMDLLPDLLKEAEEKGLPVFFYGSTNEFLEKTNSYIKEHYPLLKLAGMHSPPFRQLTDLEERKTAEKINASGAAFVFVILGCPKQEKWMASMFNRVNALMIGVGGALPVLIGAQSRAPKWMQKTGLEWLYRLLQEPRRLFGRYAITNSLFLYLLAKAYVRKRVLHQVA